MWVKVYFNETEPFSPNAKLNISSDSWILSHVFFMLLFSFRPWMAKNLRIRFWGTKVVEFTELQNKPTSTVSIKCRNFTESSYHI